MLNASASFARTFNAFGPENYRRESGPPVTVTKSFSVRNPSTTYKIQIYNGGMTDEEFERVSSSVISINGVPVVGPSEFNQNVSSIDKPVSLLANNEIAVQLRGKPGGGITIVIVGVDNDPPTIVASVSPSANANGWHNSDVTVTFTCDDTTSGVAFCPSPTALATEGANQTITGTATDNAGNSASASATVSLDKSPPVLTITSPSNGQSFTSPGITVTGTAEDLLAGVASVACNGSPASLSGMTFTCPFTLIAGNNSILVVAGDDAGNVASAQIAVTLQVDTLPPPQAILLTPSTMSILVDEERDLEVLDEQGRPRSGATWSVMPAGIVGITTDTGRPVLKGLAAGQATVTANLQGFMADATVNVVAGTSLPPGTVRWSVAPRPNFTTTQMIQASPAENAPDLYVIESGPAGETLIRALTSDGRQKWAQFHGAPNDFLLQAVPDATGGLLLNFFGSSFILRVDPSTGLQSWRYDSPGYIYYQPLAVHPDGTIYFVEADAIHSPPQGLTAFLVGIEGTTGAFRSRTELPRFSTTYLNSGGCPNVFVGHFEDNPGVGPPMINTDGSVVVEVPTTDVTRDTVPTCDSYSYYVTNTVWLVTLHLDGTSSTQAAWTYSSTGYPWPGIIPGEVIPDGSGGVLAAWTFSDNYFNNPVEARITHVTSSGSTDYSLPFNSWPLYDELGLGKETLVLGENGVAFATDGTKVVSFDTSSGTVNWTWQPPNSSVRMIGALSDGGLAALDSTAELLLLDNMGAPRPESLALQYATFQSPWSLGDWYALPNFGGSAVFSGPKLDFSILPWTYAQGNPKGQRAPKKPVFVHFVPVDPAPNLIPPYTAASFKSEVEGLPNPSRLENKFYLKQQGNPKNFLAALAEPVDGVGFIGHSIAAMITFPDSAVYATYGICFDDDLTVLADPNRRHCLFRKPTVPPDPDYGSLIAPGELQIEKISTQAKIIFIASCYLTDIFKRWWDINDQTVGRAFVFAQSPTGPVDLFHASQAWIVVLDRLADGKTLSEAVNDANAYMHQSPFFWPELLTIVGDGNVKIKR